MKATKAWFLGVALLSVCCGPALRQVAPQAPVIPKVFKGSTLPNAAALTQCDTATNTPVVVIDTAYLGTPEWNYLMVHEMKHVEQMTRYPGGCRAGSKRYTTDAWFRLDSEIEAECAELAVKARDGANYEQGIYNLTRFFWGNKSFPVLENFEWLEARIRASCLKARSNLRGA